MLKQVITALLCVGLMACTSTQYKTVQERRAEVQKMRTQTIAAIEQHQSNLRSKLNSAPGYAVFSNANVNLIFASFSGGYGVARDNSSGRDIYMKMGEAGVGFGLGAKDFRAIFVFKSRTAFDRFIEHGWMVGAHADAAAKSSDKGGATGGEIMADDVEVYQLTESGLALQATIKGTKYWKDDELN
jgi:lipid-binding SYLF domain-containing protein